MANDIDKTSPHYKGDFGSIYEVNKKFPTGGVAGDFVVIEGWAHYWNADRATWCVNAERDSYWDELITNIIEKFKLVRGATYMGVASLDTVPAKVIGAKMYYFATGAGTYKNFGDLVVPQGINVLYSENGSSWVNTTLLEVAQELGVSTKKVVSQKALNDALNLKANQSSVNEALAKKADKEEMNRLLAEKANTADVDTELGKKFDKESVVQESGEAENKVMSQKAVSDKLNDLSNYCDKNDIELYRNTTPITALQIVNDYYINNNLVPAKLEKWRYAYYPVEEGKTYLIKGTVSGNYVANICIASDIGTFTKAIVITQQNHTVKVDMTLRIGAGVKYVVFSYINVSNVFLFEKDNSTKSRLDKHDSEIFKKSDKSYVDSELIKKFDKDKVVQESGDAEDKVMSQKAVTDKLYTEVNTPIEKETEKNCYYGPSGKYVTGDIHFKIDYYPVSAGDKVKVVFVSSTPVAGLAFVSGKGQQPISFSDVGDASATINVNKVVVVPDGANYIAISSKMADNSSACKTAITNRFDVLEEKITYVDSELIKKFDKDKVVQESGEAEDKVMSQKAVTDKLYTEVNTPIEKETEKNCYYGPSGKYVTGDIHFKIDYYPVSAGDKVKVVFVSSTPVAGLAFVSGKGQQPISFSDVGDVSTTINVNKVVVVPDGANYIAISSKAADKSFAYKTAIINRFDALEGSYSISKYKGKRLLAIGDSVTDQNFWQKRVGELLGMSVRNHCKGGIGILQMVDGDESGDAPSGYDPDNFGTDKIYKLNTKDVDNVDVIIIMGFYNERKLATSTPGIKTDMYPTNDTFIGRLNYAIKRIFEELQKANNNNCRVVVCSPHKYGKYPYIDKTANEDGEDIYNAIKISSDYNSVPCIDLMHNGGINQYNWNLCQKSNSAINSNYIPADGINDGTNKPFNSQADFPPASENKGKQVTSKEYNGSFTSDGVKWNFDWEPYCWLGDQLHLSQFGGYMLGNYIAAQLLTL